MATQIFSLPNETLDEIFSDECLSNADLTRVQLSCKRFRDILGTRQIRYTFRVDAVGHPTWRLIRYLLQNPTLGERIAEINVTWERRKASDRATWTPFWRWEPQELQEIESHCERFNISEQTRRNICIGCNSESLLPFLLFFTPKLKALDLGDVCTFIVENIRKPESFFNETLYGRAYEAISDGPPVAGSEERGSEAADDYRPQKKLFFFDDLPNEDEEWVVGGPYSKLSPGLSSVERFRIRSFNSAGRSVTEPNHVLWLSNILRIFRFPRIQSVFISGITAETSSYDLEDGYDDDNDFNFPRYGSSVKHLHLECLCNTVVTRPVLKLSRYREIGALTGNLESLFIDHKRKSYPDTSENDERLVRLFLRQNKDLNPMKVVINGGGFNEAGEFCEDKERDMLTAWKQRLFEQTRARVGQLNVSESLLIQENRIHLPTAPLITLPANIIIHIFSFLERWDVFNLMLSCKALQDISYRYIWSGFAFSLCRRPNKFDITPEQCSHLEATLDKYGNRGLRNMEYLQVWDGAVIYLETHYRLLRLIANAMEDGDTPKLRRVCLELSEDVPENTRVSLGNDIDYDSHGIKNWNAVLRAILSFSGPSAPQEFQLEAEVRLNHNWAFKLCDCTKLTKLQVTSCLKYVAESMDEIWEEIRMLTDLLATFSSSISLKTLSLQTSLDQDFVYPETSAMWESFQLLQDTVLRLKNVRSLEISGYLCHPSCLLLPPENVERLKYEGLMSVSWWQKFSSHPFTGVRHLTLFPRSDFDTPDEHLGVTRTPIRRVSSNEDLRTISTSDESFAVSSLELGTVEISGLQRLNIRNAKNLADLYPRDFLELMARKNSGTSKHGLEILRIPEVVVCQCQLCREWAEYKLRAQKDDNDSGMDAVDESDS